MRMDAGQITLTVSTGIALLMFLPFADRYIRLFPALCGSLFRTSSAVRTEDKCKISRSRNTLFALSLLPLCIFVWHNGLLRPLWLEGLSTPWDFFATSGIVLGYILLRSAIRSLVPAPKLRSKVYAAYCGLPRSFLILLLSLLLPTGILMDAFSASDTVKLIVFCSLTGICYLIFLVRRFYIFASEGNFFQAILYLCTHEIVPTALLILAIVVF